MSRLRFLAFIRYRTTSCTLSVCLSAWNDIRSDRHACSGVGGNPTTRAAPFTVETFAVAMQVGAAKECVDRALPKQVRRARAKARARPACGGLCTA